MSELLMAAAGGVAAIGWGVAAISGVELVVRHPGEGRSALQYALQGALFFHAANFAPSGRVAHRRMLIGFGLFGVGFVALAAGIALTA